MSTVIAWQSRDRNARRIAQTLCLQESISEPTDGFGCGGSVLGYRVRGLFKVQGEAWPESFVLDLVRGLGRAICFEFRATLGLSSLFWAHGRARVLDQNSSAN